ncbi:MAG: hypothetical protein ACOVQ5_04360 [Flavobacteriales bacterium]|jgi:hypothetical protein
MTRKSLFLFIIVFLAWCDTALCQPVPANDENIPFLVTFSKEAGTKWGDDDYCQTFFFSIPKDFKNPIYLRVFDPEIGGKNDEMNGEFNSSSKYSVYGGAGCISVEDARNVDPIGNFKSGNLLATKVFDNKSIYDNAWYTFGPFNPSEGEYSAQYGGYIFKIICEGIKGDDGNLYRYYMSSAADKNISVEGGNAFTFEYTFRLHSESGQVSHIYPYIDEKVISLILYNFDWDNDGYIKLVSAVNPGELLKTSKESKWSESKYEIKTGERGKSLDIQFKKALNVAGVNNNNVVFYVRNQYGEQMPFFTIPIGGVPKPRGQIAIKPQPSGKR